MLIEHVMRFLVGLSDEVMIMNHGEMLYKGLPKGLSKDRKVVETYLGEGTSGRLSAQTETASVDPVDLDCLDDAAPDPWSQKAEAAARRLLMQHRSGRIYPIDFLRLESILAERTEVDDLNTITRVARDIVKAQSEGAPIDQKFELLARIFAEVAGVRKARAPSAATKQVGDVRAQAIEKAARDLVSREGSRIDARALEALRVALERSAPEEIVPALDASARGLR
ncbi:hypothetical protein LNAOJCKE_5257 [Methylorubrum aminovorans]|uniref:Uncharacterized protein n=1 Tax=Methylorubrum aminovorans TaxID=269069 RepID=A0ABQ4UL67_9HYPH|nr:hypothetical protein [Methylorubrum aminovorans]GJE68021.1 hypothetical protein LNAOJCKE_5257 [Methylorubrum aminovorans]GMA79933.1 hypothetical protein GCM10025880_63500 [Methylorubrum aminovorans]